MGRKRVEVKKILNERTRQVTFSKRKFGLMKKCYELSTLTGCEIGLIMFTPNNKLYEFASKDMASVLDKYTSFARPNEVNTQYTMAITGTSGEPGADVQMPSISPTNQPRYMMLSPQMNLLSPSMAYYPQQLQQPFVMQPSETMFSKESNETDE